MTKIKLTYKGAIDEKLDIKIISLFDKSGIDFIGSGYNKKTKTRDITFEAEQQEKPIT